VVAVVEDPHQAVVRAEEGNSKIESTLCFC
jgi:hypothetical protein